MAFFRSVTSGFQNRSRDTILKEALINNLSECVKGIQYNNQFEENFQSVLGSSDSTNTLCTALEAIFLHGLKDTFIRKAKNVLSADPDYRPQPSYWPLVLVLSHRQNIDQISSLPQINTEIGQCRAWLRIALNECLLSSYMSTLLRNISAVKPFYSKSAFVCDTEMLDLAQRLIEGLESCVQFNLPTNSSLLNKWPEDVIMAAGLWVAPIKDAKRMLDAGVDVVSTLKDEAVKPKKVPAMFRSSHSEGLTEEEVLKIILEKSTKSIDNTSDNGEYEEKKDTKEEVEEKDKLMLPEQKTKPLDIQPSTSHDDDENITSMSPLSADAAEIITPENVTVIGNSLVGKGWHIDNEDELNVSFNSNSSHGSSLIKTPEIKSLSSLPDYTDQPSDTPNLRDLMKNIHKQLKLNQVSSDVLPPNLTAEISTPEDPMLQGFGFEVVPNSLTESFTIQELQKMVKQLGSLPREHGLDFQNYQCKGCQDLLGSTVSKAKVCGYTGEYYCSNCMHSDVFIIPARVIHNWDFKRYPVSKKAGIFLLEFQHQPWIDMKKFNPKIYIGVSDMASLQDLRMQLNFLKAYIFTCREHVIKELQKLIWPREYLYDHVHLYTISDLAQIPNGLLILQLEKVVAFAKAHVFDCWLCSQKGFICEVCRDPKILYPFETSTTFRCDECSSVFHSKCLNESIPCPKCKRKQNRSSDVSLVDAVHSHFKK